MLFNINVWLVYREAASAGHCTVARILLEFGAGINTHRWGHYKYFSKNMYSNINQEPVVLTIM